ncbi:helix-turn-helix domain-containing protein [Nocardioides sp. GY 10113]|uniref:helix-turn-helix domain-containing protein n=1 Tax=Nocardioides sp. GY 10113 TaxID=2569761 RepID=UPI001F0DD53F|nr:helix-turn-helix domain-containing protein [Nocardioides sp. GY 10113]
MTDQTSVAERELDDDSRAEPAEAEATEERPTAPTAPPPTSIEVRRNVALAGVVGGLSAVLAVAFGVRALDGGTALDWASFGVLVLVVLAYGASLLDSRAPLMVVDVHGVRLRSGGRWQGIAWSEVDCLEHLPRRRVVRDGHLLVVAHDDRQLVVPLTMATRLSGATASTLSDRLAALAAGRADVVEVVPGLTDDVADHAAEDGVEHAAEDAVEHPGETAAVAADGEDQVADDPAHEPAEPDDDGGDAAAATEPPAPGRRPVYPARVEHPSAHTPRSPEPATAGSADTMTVVLDDLAVHPADAPVVGPQLAAARERLRLSVDQLSERTRIRPHVIESIEVDDFTPCGGDFYARGHLRTIARVLGIDASELVAAYDERYAEAPLDPRRVFESELATGVGGSIRGTRGGRNWSVLIAAVMAAVLVWSLARLLMDGPVPVSDSPVLSQVGSGGIATRAEKAEALPLTLTAAGGGAHLVVRDGSGDVVLQGPLAFGQTAELEVVPPVRISSSDGSVTASLGGEPAAALGRTGEDVTKTLIAP